MLYQSDMRYLNISPIKIYYKASKQSNAHPFLLILELLLSLGDVPGKAVCWLSVGSLSRVDVTKGSAGGANE